MIYNIYSASKISCPSLPPLIANGASTAERRIRSSRGCEYPTHDQRSKTQHRKHGGMSYCSCNTPAAVITVHMVWCNITQAFLASTTHFLKAHQHIAEINKRQT